MKELESSTVKGESRRYEKYYIVLIILAVVAAFGNSIFGVLLWDDEYVINRNLFIRDVANVPLLFSQEYFRASEIGHYTRSGEESYRPVVTLTHMLEYQIFGDYPRGYHGVNVLLHGLVCLVLFQLFLRLKISRGWACAGTVLYAIHPVHSEVVNMVSYREDLLAGLFVGLAFIFFLKGKRPASLFFFILALFSKEMSIVFFPLSLFYVYFDGGKRDRIFMFFLGLITLFYLYVILIIFPGQSLGAEYPGGSPASGLATMAVVILRYVRLFFVPTGLSVHYDFPVFLNILEIRPLISMLLIILALILPLARKFSWRSRFLYYWFFISVIPVSGLVPITNFIAERYLYIPFMGWCGLAVLFAEKISRRSAATKKTVGFLVLSVMVISIFLNHQRNKVWWSDTRFFTEMIRANPVSAKGYSSLGLAHYRDGDLTRAEQYLSKALSLGDRNTIALHNLGTLSMETGKTEQAIAA